MVESIGTGGTRATKGAERKASVPSKNYSEAQRLRALIDKLYEKARQEFPPDGPVGDFETLLLAVLADPDGEASRNLLERDQASG